MVGWIVILRSDGRNSPAGSGVVSRGFRGTCKAGQPVSCLLRSSGLRRSPGIPPLSGRLVRNPVRSSVSSPLAWGLYRRSESLSTALHSTGAEGYTASKTADFPLACRWNSLIQEWSRSAEIQRALRFSATAGGKPSLPGPGWPGPQSAADSFPLGSAGAGEEGLPNGSPVSPQPAVPIRWTGPADPKDLSASIRPCGRSPSDPAFECQSPRSCIP